MNGWQRRQAGINAPTSFDEEFALI